MREALILFVIVLMGLLVGRFIYWLGRRQGQSDIMEMLDGIEAEVAESMLSAITEDFKNYISAEVRRADKEREENDSNC